MAAHRHNPHSRSTAPPSKGRLGAIEQTYRLYRTELRGFFAHHTHRPEAIDDLVQEVYERLLRYRNGNEVTDPLGYMFKTAWNVLKSSNQRLRREQTRQLSCDAGQLELLASQLGRLWVDDADAALAQEELERALNRLPRACKIALIRQRRDGYSYQQIAEELQVSVNTVKDYIVRALDHCRTHFAGEHSER